MSQDFFKQYLYVAPVSLSIVRAVEGELFSREVFKRPVLDIGCGDGLFASIIYKDKIDVGLDLSLKEINLAKKRNCYANFVNANAANIPFRDNTFGTIISNCVFEHIADLSHAFTEIFRVLKPGGKYIFTAHSHLYNEYLFFSARLRSLKLNKLAEWYIHWLNHTFKHFNCLSPQEWTERLKKAGFNSISYQYYLNREVEEAFDKFLFTSIPAYLNKKLFGRWVIFPRRFIAEFWSKKLGNLLGTKADKGGALFIVAEKNED